jgi:hypothetical protein
MPSNAYDNGPRNKARSANVLTSTLILVCILALVIIAEKDATKTSQTAEVKDTTHYILADTVDTTIDWLHIVVPERFDGVHITDSDADKIKYILD